MDLCWIRQKRKRLNLYSSTLFRLNIFLSHILRRNNKSTHSCHSSLKQEVILSWRTLQRLKVIPKDFPSPVPLHVKANTSKAEKKQLISMKPLKNLWISIMRCSRPMIWINLTDYVRARQTFCPVKFSPPIFFLKSYL